MEDVFKPVLTKLISYKLIVPAIADNTKSAYHKQGLI